MFSADEYRRLAGEVEARAVEARADLTREQRRARAPWLDYDVPEAQQIVRHGDNGPQNALGMSGGRLAPQAAQQAEPHGIFDDKIIDIVKKYGISAAAAMYGWDAVNRATGGASTSAPASNQGPVY